MKTKWVRPLAVVVVVAVIGVIAWQARRVSEPVYKGETLTVWARRLSGGENNTRSIAWSPLPVNESREGIEAEQAILEMGTNALPWLLQTMRAKESIITVSFGEITRLVRGLVSGQAPKGPAKSSEIEHRRWDAALALRVLGPLAKPAVPKLAALLRDGACSRDAAYALAAIGPEAVGPLQQAMTNRTDWIQLCAIWALGQTPTNGQLAVPALLGRLQDKSPMVRFGAAWSLGKIHANPEVVAPALAAKLSDTGLNVRAMTEGALKEYGMTSVTTAALVGYLNDPKLHIRMAATNALKAIDADAAAKAGVK